MKAKYVQPSARTYNIAHHNLLANLSSKATNDDKETINNINVNTDVTVSQTTDDVW